MNLKQFPLDIESVKQIGVDKWRDGFYWPVAYSPDIEDHIKQIFHEIIKNGPDQDRELMTINYKLYIEYANLINSLLILKKLSEAGCKPLCISESIQFKGIIEKGVPLRKLLPDLAIESRTFFKKLVDGLRFAKWQFGTNPGFAAKLNSFSSRPCYYSYYANEPGKLRTYLKQKHNAGVKLTNPAYWYPHRYSNTLDSKQAKQIESFTINLIERIANTAVKWDIELGHLQREFLSKVTSELFTTTKVCMNALEVSLSRKKPINLLVGTSGNPFVRMLSLAIRKYGGTVTGFHHGSPLIYIWDNYRWLEFLTADKFVMPTKALAETLSTIETIYPPLREELIEIEGLETDFYFKLWQKQSTKPVPKKIETVMIVGCPFAQDNKVNYGGVVHSLLLLDWTFKVIDCLKKAGVKILYKKHPGGLYYGKPIDFFDQDVEIIYDRFENVMGYADAFLFGHARTTTLGHALCTNKPIIYFHAQWEQWFPEMWSLLIKRCRIIHLELDKRNRLSFKENELFEALSQLPAKPDLDFIKTYIFPKKVPV